MPPSKAREFGVAKSHPSGHLKRLVMFWFLNYPVTIPGTIQNGTRTPQKIELDVPNNINDLPNIPEVCQSLMTYLRNFLLNRNSQNQKK